MKRSIILSLTLIALFALSLSLSAFATETVESQLTFAAEASASSIQNGEEIVIAVSLAENPGFRWACVELHFDPAALTYQTGSVVGGIFAAEPYCIAVNEDSLADGLLEVTLGDTNASGDAAAVDYTGIGLLFTATFTVTEGYAGATSVTATAANDGVCDLNNQTSTLAVHAGTCSFCCVGLDYSHVPETIPGVPATCTESGWTDGSQCAVCGEILVAREPIPATSHEYTAAVTAPTCTEQGFTTFTCAACGDCYVGDYVDPAGHHWDEGVITLEPGEETSGIRLYTCTVCQATREQSIPSKNHVHEYTDAVVEPTCTEQGYTAHVCSCGDTYATDYVDALGHTFGEWFVAVEADCLSEGVMMRICSACQSEETELTPKADHMEEFVPGQAATCTQDGWTDSTQCSVCNCVLTEAEPIAAFGHTEVNVKASAASCTAAGWTAGTKCSTCGEIMSGCEVIEQLSHKQGTLTAVEATCTSTGKTEGKYCIACGEILVEQQIIAKKPHTVVTISGVEPTCFTVGWTEGSKCALCQEILEAPVAVPTLDHSIQVVEGIAATCSVTGLTEGRICSVCNFVLVEQSVIPTLQHTYDHNCDTDCNACGSVRTPAPHTFGEWKVTKNATENTEGLKMRTCTTCGESETETIPVLTVFQDRSIYVVIIAFGMMLACVVAIIVFLRKKP